MQASLTSFNYSWRLVIIQKDPAWSGDRGVNEKSHERSIQFFFTETQFGMSQDSLSEIINDYEHIKGIKQASFSEKGKGYITEELY